MDPVQSAAVLAGCCTIAGCGCAAFDPETMNAYCYPSFPQPPETAVYPPLGSSTEHLMRRRSLVSTAVDIVFRFLGCLELSNNLSTPLSSLPTHTSAIKICPTHQRQNIQRCRRHWRGITSAASEVVTTTQSTTDTVGFKNQDNINNYINATSGKHHPLPGQLLSSSALSLSSSSLSESSDYSDASSQSASSQSASSFDGLPVVQPLQPLLLPRSQTTIVMSTKGTTTPTANASTPLTHTNQSSGKGYLTMKSIPLADLSHLTRQHTSPAIANADPELQSTYFLKRAYEHRRLNAYSSETVCVL